MNEKGYFADNKQNSPGRLAFRHPTYLAINVPYLDSLQYGTTVYQAVFQIMKKPHSLISRLRARYRAQIRA